MRGKKKEASAEEEAMKRREKRMEAVEKGNLSGLTQSRKNAIVDRENRGERKGKALGAAAGALSGAAAGKKLLKGRAGAASGAATGYLTGSGLGKKYGRDRDIKRHLGKKKQAAALSPEEAVQQQVLSLKARGFPANESVARQNAYIHNEVIPQLGEGYHGETLLAQGSQPVWFSWCCRWRADRRSHGCSCRG